MKYAAAVVLGAALSAVGVDAQSSLATASGCHADNCLRPMLGANTPSPWPANAQVTADCLARKTVTTYAATSTSFGTVSSGALRFKRSMATPAAQFLDKRQAPVQTVYDVPTYAECSKTVSGTISTAGTTSKGWFGGMVRYSSACSCIGIDITPTSTVAAAGPYYTEVTEFNIWLSDGTAWYPIGTNGAQTDVVYGFAMAATPAKAVFRMMAGPPNGPNKLQLKTGSIWRDVVVSGGASTNSGIMRAPGSGSLRVLQCGSVAGALPGALLSCCAAKSPATTCTIGDPQSLYNVLGAYPNPGPDVFNIVYGTDGVANNPTANSGGPYIKPLSLHVYPVGVSPP